MKEFVKGMGTVEESKELSAFKAADEAKKEPEQPVMEEFETTEEETADIIRNNEEDFIKGLIKAAEFPSDETQPIEIRRNEQLLFRFTIRPLSSEEYERCRKKHTKYVRNKQLGMKMPEDTNKVKYQSEIIYAATIAEDRKKLWDNRKVWDALNAKNDRIMNGLDVIECVLKAGEKDKILEAIDKLSGYDSENLEEVAKN